MTITAKIISDSVSSVSQIRLVTLQLRYPKWLHGELMTHRVFSRNASSSRAIPVARLIQDVMDDPVIPVHWGANQRGMQADAECDKRVTVFGWGGGTDRSREDAWLLARSNAVKAAEAFDKAGYHKQFVNRLLEPWSHINVIVTATDWANFFALRMHKGAQPEMQVLANRMWQAIVASTPVRREPGSWHLPYVSLDEWKDMMHRHLNVHESARNEAIKVSVARCARVSYLTHDGREPDVASDLRLYDQLVGSMPLHASPAEHQATPDRLSSRTPEVRTLDPVHWELPHLHGNFRGWIQHRKTLAGENNFEG